MCIIFMCSCSSLLWFTTPSFTQPDADLDVRLSSQPRLSHNQTQIWTSNSHPNPVFHTARPRSGRPTFIPTLFFTQPDADLDVRLSSQPRLSHNQAQIWTSDSHPNTVFHTTGRRSGRPTLIPTPSFTQPDPDLQ